MKQNVTTSPSGPSAKIRYPKAKLSFRSNFLPPLFGIGLMLSVFGLLNSQWLIAQGQYYFFRPSNTVSTVVPVDTPPVDSVRLHIPKIDVDAPVVYDERSYLEEKIQKALERGVVHYGTTAMPGQAGNIVLLGHSSGQLWTPGDYKFVFTMLEKLSVNDRIFLEYKGTRYIFSVTDSKVVPPSDLSVAQHTPEPQLTLITCTPVGTDTNRLVVTAKQLYPKPSTATPVPKEDIQTLIGWSLPAN